MFLIKNGTPFNYLTPDSELTQRHIDYYLAKNTDLEDMKAVHAEEYIIFKLLSINIVNDIFLYKFKIKIGYFFSKN